MGGVNRRTQALQPQYVSSNPMYQLASGSSLPQAWFSGSPVNLPVAQLRQGFEIQLVYISAGFGPRQAEGAITAVIVQKTGVKVCCNSLCLLCTHLLHITLAWTDHIRRAQSLRDTLALSSSHMGVSSAAHQSLLTCCHWENSPVHEAACSTYSLVHKFSTLLTALQLSRQGLSNVWNPLIHKQ